MKLPNIHGYHLLACTPISNYVKHFNNEQGRSSMPIVFFTSRADHAAFIDFLVAYSTSCGDQYGFVPTARRSSSWVVL
ncbi:hypothetical protein V1508DRAFT_409723 [Lipomyces doorenjongii]|uniref:uncharacterized protein n=1 Tax=Lipomyces doorenjongii TaxID=383834 RepID=UPI0034CF92F6